MPLRAADDCIYPPPMITGQHLIDRGHTPGKWFGPALAHANAMLSAGSTLDEALASAAGFASPPAPPATPLDAPDAKPLHLNIDADTEEETANVQAVHGSMRTLLRTPMTTAGAVMPDACPAGPPGTIPVGGVVASRAIHPGMHSADICCSMALSNFGHADPAQVLDAMHAVTHFGPTLRADRVPMPPHLELEIAEHPMLRPFIDIARNHFATQGDGNHFAYVGTLRSTGDTVLVTHHGSRGFGAALYKLGMKLAEQHRARHAPEVLPVNAWIPPDTPEADTYWSALQLVREWTRCNHEALHDLVRDRLALRVHDRFWNEHNFVFRKADGLFYHAKGATPAFDHWAHDATDRTLIPLNMAQPILITHGKDAAHGLGFAPHGAGRNLSRSAHKRKLAGRTDEDIFHEETRHIDARFFCGRIDTSELPSAYKDALAVRQQIEHFGLAHVADEVLPHGCLMAGDWEHNAPWRRPRPRK